jgi:hypothetical protein
MLELSRAGNLICDRVRTEFSPSYRLKEGRLMVQTGPTQGLCFTDIVVEYRDEDRSVDYPYPGLEKFRTLRESRDVHFGKG